MLISGISALNYDVSNVFDTKDILSLYIHSYNFLFKLRLATKKNTLTKNKTRFILDNTRRNSGM